MLMLKRTYLTTITQCMDVTLRTYLRSCYALESFNIIIFISALTIDGLAWSPVWTDIYVSPNRTPGQSTWKQQLHIYVELLFLGLD